MKRCQVLSFYLNFGLGKKENGLNTQGPQSSCGTHPSKQENYTVRLPGCPDFTSLGLDFWGCGLIAPKQQLIQPFAGPAAFPTITQVACPVSDAEERKDLSSPRMTPFVQAGFVPQDGELPWGPLGGIDGFPTTEPESRPCGEQVIRTGKKTPHQHHVFRAVERPCAWAGLAVGCTSVGELWMCSGDGGGGVVGTALLWGGGSWYPAWVRLARRSPLMFGSQAWVCLSLG